MPGFRENILGLAPETPPSPHPIGQDTPENGRRLSQAVAEGDLETIKLFEDAGILDVISKNPEQLKKHNEAKRQIEFVRGFIDKETIRQQGFQQSLAQAKNMAKQAGVAPKPKSLEERAIDDLIARGTPFFQAYQQVKGKAPKPPKETVYEGGPGLTGERIKAGFEPGLQDGRLIKGPDKSPKEMRLAKRKARIEEGKIKNAAARIKLDKRRLERQGMKGDSPSLNFQILKEAIKQTVITDDMTQGDIDVKIAETVNKLREMSGLSPLSTEKSADQTLSEAIPSGAPEPQPTAQQTFNSPDDVKAAFSRGEINQEEAQQILQQQFGFD